MDNDVSHGLVLHPDFEKLKLEVEQLRVEISMLVLERDNLLYQECKNIETSYLLAVGGLEYKAYEIECAVLRLKRKMELIQAKKNRQEKVVLSEIERVLDSEFAEYKAKLNEHIDKMNAAIERSHLDQLTEAESAELKKLYRTIVKALHPDLHPGQTDAKIQLFHNAVTAYKSGNLSELRIIEAMVSEPALPELKSDGFAVLTSEKERLTKMIRAVNDRIAKIKTEYPYTMKLFLQDPEKVEERKAELEDNIARLNDVLAAYKVKIEIEEMLG